MEPNHSNDTMSLSWVLLYLEGEFIKNTETIQNNTANSALMFIGRNEQINDILEKIGFERLPNNHKVRKR